MIASPHLVPATVPVTQPKPPLKWAGGKRWLVPELRGLWSGHENRRLVEPFVGGLAVALGLAPRRALLNDLNEHVINFYEWLRNGLRVEREFLNEEDHYYRERARFNELIRSGRSRSSEAALLFYYLNRTGYNGLCRFNRKGEFNVPFGRYSKIDYRPDFAPYVEALSGWNFTCTDFEDLALEPGDFVYADPPYDVEFTSYSETAFGWPEQERLAHWLAQLQLPVVASNQATARILELYGALGFDVVLLDAPRRISCNGDRTPAREMLATRNF